MIIPGIAASAVVTASGLQETTVTPAPNIFLKFNNVDSSVYVDNGSCASTVTVVGTGFSQVSSYTKHYSEGIITSSEMMGGGILEALGHPGDYSHYLNVNPTVGNCDIGTSNFTFEMRLFSDFISSGGVQVIVPICFGTAAGVPSFQGTYQYFGLIVYSDGGLGFQFYSDNQGYWNTPSLAADNGVWVTFKIQRVGTLITFYKNGVEFFSHNDAMSLSSAANLRMMMNCSSWTLPVDYCWLRKD